MCLATIFPTLGEGWGAMSAQEGPDLPHDNLVDERDPVAQRFGARLRELMERPSVGSERLTPDALFKRLKNDADTDLMISRAHVYKLCDGEAIPRLDVIVALAKFFNVSAAYFTDDRTYKEETIAKIDSAIAEFEHAVTTLADLRAALRQSDPRPR
ncbi:Uncharacterised protein [Mycobacteroides abscessus subsp. abscessus]|nr:Uncharacterised protein [Mycobacteroides abscessus subsp. abscessus]SIC81854.1 Uncharacterised protein [Mycobacteroides abscessus subsp. abscessus]SKK31132.1 Uncharacterised protein [Mycobacteroides abscessus subsp. abscessus]SKP24859.1 Uncharacterised protein [Mycobacteroides abscessus subsp. abscessus]